MLPQQVLLSKQCNIQSHGTFAKSIGSYGIARLATLLVEAFEGGFHCCTSEATKKLRV